MKRLTIAPDLHAALHAAAAQQNISIEEYIKMLTTTTATPQLETEDRAIVDRAIELGANREDLEATGLVWAAKSFVTRRIHATDRRVDASKLSDIDLELWKDTKNHPEISRERVRRTIAKIRSWNEVAPEHEQIVLSASYIDKLRKELWALTNGKIAQISRRLIVEELEGVDCNPYDLGQFQNKKIPAISIGVLQFRALVDGLAGELELELAARHYGAVADLDRL